MEVTDLDHPEDDEIIRELSGLQEHLRTLIDRSVAGDIPAPQEIAEVWSVLRPLLACPPRPSNRFVAQIPTELN